jgi:chemotaxis protein MotB
VRDDPTPTRRIIVKKVHGGGHHGGAWKVAYADFVTTMMALFIVLWIVGQGAAVREAIAKYFRDPGVFRHGGRPAVISGGAGVLPDEQAPPGETPAPPLTREELALQQAAEEIRAQLARSGLFHVVRQQISVAVTVEGLRIEMAEREDAPVFKVGSPMVLDEMRPLLEHVARVLARLPNAITVEGHTDSRPYVDSPRYTNWELSSDRAHSARRVMEAAGLPAGRVDRVVGYADNLPSIPGDRLDPRNRRITIIVRRSRDGTAGAAGIPAPDAAGRTTLGTVGEARDRPAPPADPPGAGRGPARR